MVFVTLLGMFAVVIGFELYLQKTTDFHDERRREAHAQFDSELGWAPIPNYRFQEGARKVTSNSHGFRSNEIESEKKQILVLGDSVVWGFKVSDDETIPYFLEQKFDPEEYQVHNLGVSGYGIGQYYLYLKRHVDMFKNLEHVVLVISSYNDIANTASNTYYGLRKPLYTLEDGRLTLTDSSIQYFCLRNIMGSSYLSGRLLSGRDELERSLGRAFGDRTLNETDTSTVIGLLIEKIHDITTKNGGELTVVLSPQKTDFSEKSDDLKWFQTFFRTQTAYNFVDYFEILKNSLSEPSEIFIDATHYTRRGNSLLAQAMLE